MKDTMKVIDDVYNDPKLSDVMKMGLMERWN